MKKNVSYIALSLISLSGYGLTASASQHQWQQQDIDRLVKSIQRSNGEAEIGFESPSQLSPQMFTQIAAKQQKAAHETSSTPSAGQHAERVLAPGLSTSGQPVQQASAQAVQQPAQPHSAPQQSPQAAPNAMQPNQQQIRQRANRDGPTPVEMAAAQKRAEQARMARSQAFARAHDPDLDTRGIGGAAESSDRAFKSIVRQALPMTPEQIQSLRSLFNQTQEAAAMRYKNPPSASLSSQMVRLEPGASSPIVRLAQGFVSTVVFVDETGGPWPIYSYTLGNSKDVNVNWDRKSNMLMLQSNALYPYSNLSVRLEGLETPVLVTLVPGRHKFDSRADLQVSGQGPNPKPVILSDLPDSKVNFELLGILDGIGPLGGKLLDVSGGDAQAWYADGSLYVRTRYTILSPGWIAKVSSADGMHAYKMHKTPMILVSLRGKPVQLKLEGF